MNNRFRNDEGITLVELLAVIAIGSLVFLIGINIHLLIQENYSEQKLEAQHLFDVSYAVKTITKEVRMADEVSVQVEADNHLKINDTDYNYNSIEKSIEKDRSPFVMNIDKFYVNKTEDKNGNMILEMEIVPINESLSNRKIYTELVLRGGS